MIIHSINTDQNLHVINLLKIGLSTVVDPAVIENYHPDYYNHNSNIFFLLKNGRYQVGNYFVLENNGQYLASAGWNHYDQSTAILLSRAFVIPQYRTQYLLAQYILPIQISQSSHYQHQWICSNEHNSAIYHWFSRTARGQRSALFANWPDIYKKFHPIGQKNIYYTPQWVVEYQK